MGAKRYLYMYLPRWRTAEEMQEMLDRLRQLDMGREEGHVVFEVDMDRVWSLGTHSELDTGDITNHGKEYPFGTTVQTHDTPR